MQTDMSTSIEACKTLLAYAAYPIGVVTIAWKVASYVKGVEKDMRAWAEQISDNHLKHIEMATTASLTELMQLRTNHAEMLRSMDALRDEVRDSRK